MKVSLPSSEWDSYIRLTEFVNSVRFPPLRSLSSFIENEVPHIAIRFNGAGHEANFRQDFLEGVKQGLRVDGLHPHIRLEENRFRGNDLVGRTDARLEHFIFEFKSPGDLAKGNVRAKALTDLLEKMDSASNETRPKWAGLLTDGFQAGLVTYHEPTGKYRYVDGCDVPLPTGREILDWKEIAGSLARMIPGMARPHLSSETMLEYFGLETEVARDALRALWKQLNEGRSEFARLLYEQWRELFALAVGFSITDTAGEDLVELFQMGGHAPSKEDWDQAVFAVHTYYSILLKLLAIRIVDELGLAGQVSILKHVASSPSKGMIEAERTIPESLGNLIERDVFSWPYCDQNWPLSNAVSSAITTMAEIVQKFDVQGVKSDTLRRVYQNVIPRKLRKSLGEFYTPNWAAKLLLKEVGYDGRGRLLDPACGSGTFLVEAIRLVLEKNEGPPQSRLSLVCRTIVGFDLNPVAVATARLNYVLALVDTLLATRLTEPLHLPVFLADSILLPEVESPSSSSHFNIPTRVGVFKVPLLTSDRSEKVIVESTRQLFGLLRKNCASSLSDFLSDVRRRYGAQAEEENRDLLARLHKTINDLHINLHDGMWSSIVENFFAPKLEGRFEFVVGNPPWVIPRRTPKSYTERVREAVAQTADRILLEPAQKGSILQKHSAAEKQYSACTPFVWRAMRSYSVEGGKIAFLMTSSMLSTISAGGWRRWVTQFSISKIIDMTLVTDIHEGALCWSHIPIFENRPGEDSPLDYWFCIGADKHGSTEKDVERRLEWNKWRTTPQDLPISITRTENRQETRTSSDAPWLVAPPEILAIVRKMQAKARETMIGKWALGEIYSIHMGFKADGWKYFAFQGTPSIEDGVAKGKNKAGEALVVEADLVFATAVAKSLKPWRYSTNYAFLPLDKQANPLPESELRKNELAWEYLTSHKRILVSRAVVTKGFVNKWFGVLVPKAAKATAKVAHRLIATQLEAATLPATVKFASRQIPLLPDQSTRFIGVEDPGEASYLAGLMNSSPLRCIAYMCATPKGGIPSRAFKAWNVGLIPIVQYDKDNPNCKNISSIASGLAENPERAEETQKDLDVLVSQLYGITNAEARQLTGHLLMLQGISPREYKGSKDTIEDLTTQPRSLDVS